jgi:para-nitrobenzyl esterase
MKTLYALSVALIAVFTAAHADQVKIESGLLEGTTEAGIRIFKGIPYAAPPVGDLRWKAPQPVAAWEGVRKADQFGARSMQGRIFDDMIFRDSGPSEDCLYLNVWTPAKSAGEKLPVMVWVYGGGFVGGGSSEPRQDGTNLAKKGVIVVSMNYRLGIFGFFSHPDLTKESGHNSSGNYGLMDQAAALDWVHRNIAAFGGDPARVTIFGESAGSFSVSALMASPLSRDLIAGAIGESGAFFSETLAAQSLEQAEQKGLKFAETAGADSLAALRGKDAPRFGPNIDGYFLPNPVPAIFAAGEQAHVPLLAGWNEHEGGTPEGNKTTVGDFVELANKNYGDAAAQFLNVLHARTDAEARESASFLAGARFIAFGTWKWIEAQLATGGKPVYRYRFDDRLPQPAGTKSRGAYHSAEIEFVFDNLANKNLPFGADDRKLAAQMSSYWSNFGKTGDPNGPGLPNWPVYDSKTGFEVMHLDAVSKAAPDDQRKAFEFLDTHHPASTK